MIQIQQKSEFKPIEKRILNSGYVIICDNIQEHKLTDELQQEHIYYTYTETRYSQLEYLEIVEKQAEAQAKQLEQLWDISEKYLRERYTF